MVYVIGGRFYGDDDGHDRSELWSGFACLDSARCDMFLGSKKWWVYM